MARSRACFSPLERGRHEPFARSPSASGPIETRTSRNTSIPSLSSIRRIWRFFPSSSTIVSQVFRSPRRRIPAFVALKHIAIFRLHALHQFVRQVRFAGSLHLHVIRLFEMRFRGCNPGGPFGVVCQQQQALAGLVEPAYRRNPRQPWRQIGVDSIASLFIGGCGYSATRLVQDQIYLLFGLHCLPDRSSMRSAPSRTGVSGLRGVVPLSRTRPSRISLTACEREQ